jgi:hypothetical protein
MGRRKRRRFSDLLLLGREEEEAFPATCLGLYLFLVAIVCPLYHQPLRIPE